MHLTEAHQISERKARILKLSRTVLHYHHRKQEKDDELIEELNKLAARHPGYGFWKMYQLLRLDVRTWNHKRIYRVYTQMKLNIRRKYKRRLPNRAAVSASIPFQPNEMWSMDFMHDALYNGRKVKILNVIEEFNARLWLWLLIRQ